MINRQTEGRFVKVLVANIAVYYIVYSRSQSNTKTLKKFDYTMIMDRLRIVSWSNISHPTGVVDLRFKGQTFPVLATVVHSKGQTIIKFMNNPLCRDQGPTAIPVGEVIKFITQTLMLVGLSISILWRISSYIHKNRLCSAKSVSELRSKDCVSPDLNKRPKGPLSLTWVQWTRQKIDFGMDPK